MRLACLLATALVGCSGYSPGEPFRLTDEMRLAALQSASVGSMMESLKYIEAWHIDNRTGIAPLLNSGIEESAIDTIESELGCRLPRELLAVWRWRNGHRSTETAQWFVWYHQLMPAEESMQQYRYLRSEPLFEWDRSWFPVMYFQEEWYFVECAGATVEASPLMFYFVENGPREAYLSLTSYFATARQAMEGGNIFVDGEGAEMGRDIKSMAAAHAKHNPGITFPYFVPE
jgi:hypothetical protein